MAITQDIINMQRAGLSDAEIISRLREQGYSDRDINNSFNQARANQLSDGSNEYNEQTNETSYGNEGEQYEDYETEPQQQAPMPEYAAPASQYEAEQYEQAQQPPEFQGYETGETGYAETFEEVAESIIEEKWRDFMDKVGDVQLWKEQVERDMARIDKRIERIEDSLVKINAALLEKVTEYGKSIRGLGTDVKAMEKAVSSVIEPLMKNTKELKEIKEKHRKR